MYKKLGILAIAAMLLLAVGFADGVAAHSIRETVERMPIPDVLAANNSENHLVPVVTPLDSGTGYLGDITIQGTAISKFDRIGAWGWNVYVDNVVEGPTEMKDKTISIYLTSADPTVYPRGTMDSNINVGDIVEAYGGSASGYDISLTGSANYYLKYLGLPVTAAHGAAPRGMSEVISNTTPTFWPVESQETQPAVQKVPTGEQDAQTQNYVVSVFNLTSRPSYLITEDGQRYDITWNENIGDVEGNPAYSSFAYPGGLGRLGYCYIACSGQEANYWPCVRECCKTGEGPTPKSSEQALPEWNL